MNITKLINNTKIIELKYKKYLFKLSLPLAIFPTGSLKSQDIYLKGKYLEIGIHSAFSFGSSMAPPAGLNLHHRTNNGNGLGFVCDYDKNGWAIGNPAFMGDYFTPGDPVEGWGVQWNDSVNKRNFPIADFDASWDIVSSRFVQTAHGSQIGTIWEATTSNGINQKLFIEQTLTLDTNSTFFNVSINLKNTGSEKLNNVKYWRSLDPDNEHSITGDYSTLNKILKQVGYNGNQDTALVEARGLVHNVPIFLGAIDSRARVSRENFINYHPDGILNNVDTPGVGVIDDMSINIAFELEDIDVGECKTFTFFYALSDKDINKIGLPLQNNFSLEKNVLVAKEVCTDTDSIVHFYDFSSGPGSQYISKNEWDFDNDGVYDRIGDSVTWVYKSFGKHLVNKRITLCNNAVYDTAIYVKINPSVKAQFDVFDSTFCRNIDTVIFTNTSTSKASLSYKWTLENDSILTTENIHRKFSIDSIYSVKLFSYNDSGCMDSTSFSDTSIVLHVPEASFSINDANQCEYENSYTFTNLSSTHYGAIESHWLIGDSLVENTTNVTNFKFPQADSVTIELAISNVNGCKDTVSKRAIILPQPRASFTINKDSQCLNNQNFIVENTSTLKYGSASQIWKYETFEDTSTKVTLKKYNTDGNYTIRLVVLSDSNCVVSIEKDIFINPEPTLSFTINDSAQCLGGNTFDFTNTTQFKNDPAISTKWTAGDLSSFNGTDWINKSFAMDDTFNVELEIETRLGCSSSLTKKVILHPMPVASFTINNLEQCLQSNSYQYTNTSTAAFGTLTNTWTLESLGKINRENIDTNYTSADTFTVKLVVETLTGCLDSISKEVIVRPMPTANFTISDAAQCFKNNTVDFTNTTTIKYGDLNHQWFLGDGDTSTTMSITNKNFGTADTFYNKLVSISTFGCEDTIIKEIYVHPNPQANFAINNDTQCFSKQSFNYTNTSVVQYNKPMTFSWNLGDARIRASQDVNNLQYLNPGTYTVLLETMSDLNCMDTLSKVIVVPKKPVAGFTTRDSSQCLIGNSFNMDNTSTADIGNVTSVWNLQDGTRFTSDDINNKSFDRDGVYTVQLIVEDAATCKDTFVNNVIVHPHPVAIIQASSTCINEPFTISAASTIKNTAIVKTTWDFGDGTQASTSNPVKYFGNAANYLVRLTEESDQRCKHDTSQMVTVWAKPNAQFTSAKFRSTVNEVEYQYTDQSTTVIDWWLWKFGDGQISNSQNPLITYSDTGTFFTQLIVRNNHGCLDSTSLGPDLIAPDFFLHIPNAFSPNGDGKNEVFGPVMSKYFINYSMVIYNKWGEKLFESTDGSFWNGMYRNKLVPEGTYMYNLYAVDLFGENHIRRGSINVLR